MKLGDCPHQKHIILQIDFLKEYYNTSLGKLYTERYDCHDVTEILLKVALNTITLNLTNTVTKLSFGIIIKSYGLSGEYTELEPL
jgi:hypothetical protein